MEKRGKAKQGKRAHRTIHLPTLEIQTQERSFPFLPLLAGLPDVPGSEELLESSGGVGLGRLAKGAFAGLFVVLVEVFEDSFESGARGEEDRRL
jgi:hypothetical protein